MRSPGVLALRVTSASPRNRCFTPLGFHCIPTYCLVSVYRPVRAVWISSTIGSIRHDIVAGSYQSYLNHSGPYFVTQCLLCWPDHGGRCWELSILPKPLGLVLCDPMSAGRITAVGAGSVGGEEGHTRVGVTLHRLQCLAYLNRKYTVRTSLRIRFVGAGHVWSGSGPECIIGDSNS